MRLISTFAFSVVLLAAGSCICIAAQQLNNGRTAVTFEGIWEAEDGSGGAVGINLWQESSSSPHGGPPVDGNQVPHPVPQIGAYQRAHARVRCLEESFSDTGWRGHKDAGVSAELIGEHLVVTYPQFPGEKAMDLDLTWDNKADVWRGRFHIGAYDKQVVLHRAPDRPSHDQEICSPRYDGFRP
jgi:hypothetical protein